MATMAPGIEDIGKVCRFCLRREGLKPLSSSMSSTFSVEDVIHFTGIQILENEETAHYSICLECCVVIKNSVFFRRTCLKNDAVFKQLVVVVRGQTNETSVHHGVQAVDSAGSSSCQQSMNGVQLAQCSGTDIEIVYLRDNGSTELKTEPMCEESIQPTLNVTTTVQPTVTRVITCGSAEMLNLKRALDIKPLHSNVDPLGRTDFNGAVSVVSGVEMRKSTVTASTGDGRHQTYQDQGQPTIEHGERSVLTCTICGEGFTDHKSHFYHMKNSHGLAFIGARKLTSFHFTRLSSVIELKNFNISLEDQEYASQVIQWLSAVISAKDCYNRMHQARDFLFEPALFAKCCWRNAHHKFPIVQLRNLLELFKQVGSIQEQEVTDETLARFMKMKLKTAASRLVPKTNRKTSCIFRKRKGSSPNKAPSKA